MSNGPSDQLGDGPAPGLASVWPWLALPVALLTATLVALHLIYADDFTFIGVGIGASCPDDTDARLALCFIEAPFGRMVHFEDLMVYLSVLLLHVCLCLLAVLYAAAQIRRLPDPVARRSWQLAGTLLIVLAVFAVIARFDATALQLTYRNTCDLLQMANVSPHIVPEDCYGGAPSILFWLAVIPTIAGLIAAVFGAGLASSAVSPPHQTSESAWRLAFADRARTLQRSLYAASTVLFTSTVAISLFLHLPARLAANETTELVITSAARGLTVFWGTVFTITLVMIYAPAAFHLMRHVRRVELTAGEPVQIRTWLDEQVLASTSRKLASVVAFIAPLLVGPIGSLL